MVSLGEELTQNNTEIPQSACGTGEPHAESPAQEALWGQGTLCWQGWGQLQAQCEGVAARKGNYCSCLLLPAAKETVLWCSGRLCCKEQCLNAIFHWAVPKTRLRSLGGPALWSVNGTASATRAGCVQAPCGILVLCHLEHILILCFRGISWSWLNSSFYLNNIISERLWQSESWLPNSFLIWIPFYWLVTFDFLYSITSMCDFLFIPDLTWTGCDMLKTTSEAIKTQRIMSEKYNRNGKNVKKLQWKSISSSYVILGLWPWGEHKNHQKLPFLWLSGLISASAKALCTLMPWLFVGFPFAVAWAGQL